MGGGVRLEVTARIDLIGRTTMKAIANIMRQVGIALVLLASAK